MKIIDLMRLNLSESMKLRFYDLISNWRSNISPLHNCSG